MLEEGAITEKWRANFNPEMKKLKKSISELKKVARKDDQKAIASKKKECKEHVKNMRDIINDIPDDNVGSWLVRIFLTSLPEFIIDLSNLNTAEGKIDAATLLFPSYIGIPPALSKMIKAAIQGDRLGEVSRNDMHRILDGLEKAIDNV
jgi:hypothetical protein